MNRDSVPDLKLPPGECIYVSIPPFIGCVWDDTIKWPKSVRDDKHLLDCARVYAFSSVLGVVNRLDPQRTQRRFCMPSYGTPLHGSPGHPRLESDGRVRDLSEDSVKEGSHASV